MFLSVFARNEAI